MRHHSKTVTKNTNLYIRPIIGRYYLKDGALQILANCLLIETEKESLFLWLFAVSK